MKFSLLFSGVAVLALGLLDIVNGLPNRQAEHTLEKRAVYSGVNKPCPTGFYATGNTIANKGKLCLACSNFNRYAATCSASGILSCKSPGYLTQTNGKNVCTTRCPNGTFSDTFKRICVGCMTKDKNAITCTATTVTSCKSGFLLSAGKCVTTCPTKTYADTPSKSCKACSDPLATKCTATGATGCNSSSFLSAGKCFRVCPTGTYGSTRSRNCIDCGLGVATCDPVTGQAKTCDKNSAGSKTYFDAVTKKCAVSCSGMTYPDSATASCKPCAVGATKCKSATEAITCGTVGGATYYLQGTSCVKECKAGFFARSNQCAACSTGSLTCDSGGNAKTCAADSNGNALVLLAYKDQNASTVDKCISMNECENLFGFYPDPKSCLRCSDSKAHAVDCTASSVTSCADGYELVNNRCITKSYSKYFVYFYGDSDENFGRDFSLAECAERVRQSKNYAEATDLIVLDAAQCKRRVPSQPLESFEYELTVTLLAGTCQENSIRMAGYQCEDVTTPLQPVVCTGNTFYQHERCVTKCKAGNYGKENVCVPCGEDINTCSMSGEPETCRERGSDQDSTYFYAVDKTCISYDACDAIPGYLPEKFDYNSQRICTPCPISDWYPNSLECSWATGATKCPSGYELNYRQCQVTAPGGPYSVYSSYLDGRRYQTDQNGMTAQECAQSVLKQLLYVPGRDSIVHVENAGGSSCGWQVHVNKPFQSEESTDPNRVYTSWLNGTCQQNAQYDSRNLPCEDVTF